MIKRGTWFISFGIALLFIVAVLITAYLNEKYFFNPLTFRNNDVLYLPWKWYTNPLNIQIYTLTGPGKVVTVENSVQIRHVINELEKGNTNKGTINQMSKLTEPSYGIMVRTQNTTVLQTAILYPSDQVVEIWTQHGSAAGNEFISLTPNLLQYVKQQLETQK